MEFAFPTGGDEPRNVSDWVEFSTMDSMKVEGVSEQTAAKIKSWGLQGRFVIVPGSVDRAAIYLQLLPLTQNDMVSTFLDANGQQVVETNSADIPSLCFRGKEAGVGPTGLADMVPVADKLMGGTGLGILPILLSTGGEIPQFPPTAAIRTELFMHMRKVVAASGSVSPKEWDVEFRKDTFPDVPAPELLWPSPDDVPNRVDEGE